MANEGYSLGMTGGRVRELLLRHFIVPTLDTTPSANTKSWSDGGIVVEFRIGELCRVRENEEWQFYRLEDIVGDTRVWTRANASELPDMSDYYTKEQTDKRIDDKVSEIEFPEDESVKTLTEEEYTALGEEGKISNKTVYMVEKDGAPVALYVGSILIAQREEGSRGFPYNFPIIF